MPDKIKATAAFASLTSIGGLLWLSHSRTMSYRIERTALVDDGFAGPSIRFRLKLPPADSEEGRPILNFRIADGNRVLPLFYSSGGVGDDTRVVDLPLGYSIPFRHPELVIYENKDVKQRIVIESLPAPLRSPLLAKPHPLFRFAAIKGSDVLQPIVYDSSFPSNTVLIQSKRPLTPEEFWEITVIGTPFVRGLNVTSNFNKSQMKGEVAIPYGNEIDAAEVVMRKLRYVKRTSIIRVKNLKLTADRSGQTVLVVPEDKVETLAPEFRIRVAQQLPDESLSRQYPDSKNAVLRIHDISMVSTKRITGVRLVHPRAGDLGLKAFSAQLGNSVWGGATSNRTAPKGPVSLKPFTATVAIDWISKELVDTSRAYVPIEHSSGTENAPTPAG